MERPPKRLSGVAWQRTLLESHPRIAKRLLAEVPRLERVAAIVGAAAMPGGADEQAAAEVVESPVPDGVSVRYGGAILRAASNEPIRLLTPALLTRPLEAAGGP